MPDARPFSAVVRSPEWLADAGAWATAALSGLGDARHEPVGPARLRRVRPWSAQVVLPTRGGDVWLKACADYARFEPGLQVVLARLAPDHVQEPLAVDAARGWLLTADHGPSVGEGDGEQGHLVREDWVEVVRLIAQLHVACADAREELLATGVPDRSPATVPARLDALVALLSARPDEEPGHLSASRAEELLGLRPAVAQACEVAESIGLPLTWVHGDLHRWNVYAEAGSLRVFDLGDSQWSNPLTELEMPRHIVGDDPLVRMTLLDEVLAPWGRTWRDVTPEVATAVAVLHQVNRAEVWLGATAQADEDERRQWGASPEEELAALVPLLLRA